MRNGEVGFIDVLLVAGVIAGTGLIALQSSEIEDLRATNSALADRARFPYTGFQLPDAQFETTDGQMVAIGAPGPGRRQLLYYFTTRCQFCRASIPIWEELRTALSSDANLDIIGLSLDSLGPTLEYQQEHRLPPVGLVESDRDRALLKAGAVPVTLVADSLGRVVYSVLGVPSAAALDSIRDALEWTARDSGVGTTGAPNGGSPPS